MFKTLSCALLVIFGICLAYGYLIFNADAYFQEADFAKTGNFGDSWGALTSIFSALGFCGVLITLKLQNDAMSKIDSESKKRDESEKMRDFENSFFNMLNILQTIIKDMRVGGDDKKVKKEGRSIFTHYYSRFKNDCLGKGDIEHLEYIEENDFSREHEMKNSQSSSIIIFREDLVTFHITIDFYITCLSL